MDFWGHNNFFKFLDFKKDLKIGLNPVGKIYIVCALLHNARTYLYGNKTSTYFDCEPQTVEEYAYKYFCLSAQYS